MTEETRIQLLQMALDLTLYSLDKELYLEQGIESLEQEARIDLYNQEHNIKSKFEGCFNLLLDRYRLLENEGESVTSKPGTQK